MRNAKLILLIAIVLFGCGTPTTNEQSTVKTNNSPATIIPVTPPEKIIYWILETHDRTKYSFDYLNQILSQIDTQAVVHVYLEGKWKKGTVNVARKHTKVFDEESNRVVDKEEATSVEKIMQRQENEILDWIQKTKSFQIPNWSIETALWWTLYQSGEVGSIKAAFYDEYVPNHKAMIDSLKKERYKYAFILDNEFYQRVCSDTNKIIIVNLGTAHRRAIWKIIEDHPQWVNKMFLMGADPNIDLTIRAHQFCDFLLFSEAEYKNFAYNK